MSKVYEAPKLSVYGNLAEITQVVGPSGGGDTFFSAAGVALLTGNGSQDVTATSPVTPTNNVTPGVTLS